MNILLTSVGRRTYMISFFKEVLSSSGGKVFASNSELDSPALWLADNYVQSPLIYSAEYAPFLLKYCKENNIGAVLSLFDIELPVLSKLKPAFKKEGIRIIVADEWVTATANDKWQTFQFLKANNFNTVPTYVSVEQVKLDLESGKLSFPLFVKPRWGMGSLSIFKAENEEELFFYCKIALKEIEKSYLKYESKGDWENAILIQKAISGNEYGLDIINDLHGNYCTTVVKQKLAMRSGETDAAITVDEPVLQNLGKKISELTRHPANMDVDVFFDGNKPYILEINPRFGGGYPFSHVAGVNLPQAIVDWLINKTVDKERYLNPKIGVKAAKGIMMVVDES
jgi:carbamoyl-phosphate synthase large subunit